MLYTCIISGGAASIAEPLLLAAAVLAAPTLVTMIAAVLAAPTLVTHTRPTRAARAATPTALEAGALGVEPQLLALQLPDLRL